MLKAVLEEIPPELAPKADNYFYKKHSEHAGFNLSPELQAVLDSQKRAKDAATAFAEKKKAEASEAPAA